ncbi:hypothetical protein QBA57_37660 [Streptomyces scabiei]|nr:MULTISPECIES: hypothetical protein [Streptomyces]MBP5865776.1 hypothetical protein [Streptomyces sp. LBUM 1484]MBP5873028.1 hypothetical protein [Streptomyces sp. LBUM 1485]MBP5881196.1 hypothetical protein [Streptomyces sp. LBUM 1487]MBP5895930.1 hypothetical protein [Streptomyces sp. LBUM 1481]MBP5896962.1 hypothetical protein [Streptomyces sp. LBUM 1488]
MPRKGARGGGADRDVETALDELYATPPPSFVARREELTAEARADGRVEDARRIRAARRPSLAAWTANLLLRSEPEESRRFLELGRALREAYRSLDAGGIKELSEQRRSIVAVLSRQAAGLAAEAGHRLSEPVRREVEATLRAVLADEEAAGRWATGHLESALTPPTDLPGDTAGAAPSAAPLAPARSTAAPSAASRSRAKDEVAERRRQKQKQKQEREQKQEQLARAREAARAADRRVRDLRAARTDAQAVRQRARDRYDTAENDVSEAERLLRRAREELRGADRDRQRAEKECAAAAEAVSGAERTAREAARDVSRLSGRSAD